MSTGVNPAVESKLKVNGALQFSVKQSVEIKEAGKQSRPTGAETTPNLKIPLGVMRQRLAPAPSKALQRKARRVGLKERFASTSQNQNPIKDSIDSSFAVGLYYESMLESFEIYVEPATWTIKRGNSLRGAFGACARSCIHEFLE